MKEVTVEGINEWISLTEANTSVESDVLERDRMVGVVRSVATNIGYWQYHLDNDKFDYHFYCTECGAPENSSWAKDVRQRLLEEKRCHGCSLWGSREENYISKGTKNVDIVIGGVLYKYRGFSTNTHDSHLGHGGRMFSMVNLETDELVVTNNLWHLGVIPKKYRETTMKDTHRIVGNKG